MITKEMRAAQLRAIPALDFAKRNNNQNLGRLSTIENVLEKEDSLQDLQRELQHYQIAQTERAALLGAYKAMVRTGLTEDIAIKIFVPSLNNTVSAEEVYLGVVKYQMTVDDKKAQQNKALYGNLRNAFAKRTSYSDEEEMELAQMVREMGLPVGDFLEESLRVRQAHIELFCMQVDWLKKKNRAEKQNRQKALLEAQRLAKEKKKNGKLAPVEAVLEETSSAVEPQAAVVEKPKAPEEPFVLEGWQLFTTKEFWSRDPNDLIPLPSGSRAETVAAYKKTVAGSISVKPQSVIKTVEFCVSGKDILTKSLDTRLRHGSRELREWIRLPRGNDRVVIYVPSVDQKVAIFFSGPRSIVYKNIKRA